MAIVWYFLCLILLAPVAVLAGFALLIESVARTGFWKSVAQLLILLGDPGGGGWRLWAALACFPLLITLGLWSPSRPAGFLVLAVLGVASFIYVSGSYEGIWMPESWVILLRSLVGTALSAYFAIREWR